MATEENLNAARPVQVGAHSPEPLRVALEKTCDRFEAMAARNGDVRLGADAVLKAIHEPLTAHPVEPAGVSDEAVEAGAEAYWDYNRDAEHYPDAEEAWDVLAAEEQEIYRDAARSVLEGAAPFMQPQVVASRERVAEALLGIEGFEQPHEEHGYDASCALCRGNAGQIADALLAAGVFREPERTCGAEHPRGFGRCVFVAGHHYEAGEDWTPHADRLGRSWNAQPAEEPAGVDSTVNRCPGCGVKVIGHERCGDPTRPGCAS